MQEENGMDLKEELGRVMRQYVDKNIVSGRQGEWERNYTGYDFQIIFSDKAGDSSGCNDFDGTG